MEKLEKEAIEILQVLCAYDNCVISDSGGKDSSVLKHIALKAREIYGLTRQQKERANNGNIRN